MSIQDFRASATARSLHFFVMDNLRDDFDLNPPYQRGVAWGTKRRRNLIRSLLAGIPIPSIVINDRLEGFEGQPLPIGDPMYAVVDGKQRITALRSFVDSEFSVPGDWFGDEYADSITFADLTISDQRRFLHRPIAVSEAKLPTLDDEQEMFDLINFGGLAQGETDDDLPN